MSRPLLPEPTADELLDSFWIWRVPGRTLQTLQQDLELYLTGWQPRVGWQVCSAVYNAAMARRQWDIEQGGRSWAPSRPLMPLPSQGGLRAYL